MSANTLPLQELTETFEAPTQAFGRPDNLSLQSPVDNPQTAEIVALAHPGQASMWKRIANAAGVGVPFVVDRIAPHEALPYTTWIQDRQRENDRLAGPTIQLVSTAATPLSTRAERHAQAREAYDERHSVVQTDNAIPRQPLDFNTVINRISPHVPENLTQLRRLAATHLGRLAVGARNVFERSLGQDFHEHMTARREAALNARLNPQPTRTELSLSSVSPAKPRHIKPGEIFNV